MIFRGKQLQSSDSYLQTPNNDLTRDFVYTHQEHTKVAKLVKKDITLKAQKIAVNQAKFIFRRKSRFFQKWVLDSYWPHIGGVLSLKL